jgi:hypothetical protein
VRRSATRGDSGHTVIVMVAVSVHTKNAYGEGSGYTVPFIHNVSTTGQALVHAAIPMEKDPLSPMNRGWVGLRASKDTLLSQGCTELRCQVTPECIVYGAA